MSGNGIGVDNASAASSNHCPDATIWVQNSELEGCTSRGIQLLNVCLFLCQITAEGSRPDLGSNQVNTR